MNALRFYRNLLGLSVLLLAACSQTPAPQAEATLSAQATTTIDFGTLDDDFQPYTEDGFTLTSVFNGQNTASGFVRVSDYLSPGNFYAFPNFGFDEQDILLTNDAALPFSLSSLELIEGNVFPSPRTVTIQGTRTDSTVVEQTFTTDGVAGRETFLVSNFSNLTSLRLGAGASMGEVGVDNLILDVAAPDTTPPSVSVNQASDQADPTSSSPVFFVAAFSEPINESTVDAEDFNVSGTAGAILRSIQELGNNAYRLMLLPATSGTIIVSIPAGVITDLAGNPNTASTSTDNTVTYVAPDTTAPTITLTTPTDGATYKLKQSVVADYACADEADGSGLASCVGTVPDGSAIDTASVGNKTFTVTATDNQGNTTSTTVSYKVIYDFKGFFFPVRNAPALNQVKAGWLIPFSFSLGGNFGRNVITSTVSAPINCSSLAPQGSASATQEGSSASQSSE